MDFNGVPLHPLVVHATVVFVPLAALFAAVFALRPSWRWLLRWPTLALAAVSAGTTQLAVMSGESLKDGRHLGSSLIERHEEWAGRLQTGVWVLAAAVLVAWWVLPATTPVSGRGDRESRVGVLTWPLVVLLPVVAVAVLVLVYLTGDAGARAVWASKG